MKYLVRDDSQPVPADLTTCPVVAITGAEYGAALMMANPPASVGSFDPGAAGQYFGMAFASTIVLWSVAYGAGRIVKMLK